jgi:hypothetical protein
MDFRRAEFVRFVADHERIEDLVDEAKSDTWTKAREHAVLTVQTKNGDAFVMVRGGFDGILLDRRADGKVVLEIENEPCVVVRLGWHVHPQPTGPSDHDRAVLDLLDQESSMLCEVNGPRGGTLFTRLSNRRI